MRRLLAVFRNRAIDLYRDEQLVRNLHRLMIVERRYGFKLEAVCDEFGHADRAIALSIILPPMLDVANSEPPAVASSEPDLVVT